MVFFETSLSLAAIARSFDNDEIFDVHPLARPSHLYLSARGQPAISEENGSHAFPKSNRRVVDRLLSLHRFTNRGRDSPGTHLKATDFILQKLRATTKRLYIRSRDCAQSMRCQFPAPLTFLSFIRPASSAGRDPSLLPLAKRTSSRTSWPSEAGSETSLLLLRLRVCSSTRLPTSSGTSASSFCLHTRTSTCSSRSDYVCRMVLTSGTYEFTLARD